MTLKTKLSKRAIRRGGTRWWWILDGTGRRELPSQTGNVIAPVTSISNLPRR